MIDLILVLIILSMVIPALLYVIKSKKNGVKCIGCNSECSSNCSENKI